VKLDELPLVTRVCGLPDLAPETSVQMEISNIDLLELGFTARFLHKLHV
jgi:exoribonuclease-2